MHFTPFLGSASRLLQSFISFHLSSAHVWFSSGLRLEQAFINFSFLYKPLSRSTSKFVHIYILTFIPFALCSVYAFLSVLTYFHFKHFRLPIFHFFLASRYADDRLWFPARAFSSPSTSGFDFQDQQLISRWQEPARRQASGGRRHNELRLPCQHYQLVPQGETEGGRPADTIWASASASAYLMTVSVKKREESAKSRS